MNFRKEYILHFDNTFRISTHLDILKKLNLAIDLDVAGSDKERKEEISQSGFIPKMFNFYLKRNYSFISHFL